MLHTFGPVITDQGVKFRLWAPAARRVEVLLDKPIAMTREANGWYVADVAGAAAGTRYKFRIDGEVEGLQSLVQVGDVGRLFVEFDGGDHG